MLGGVVMKKFLAIIVMVSLTLTLVSFPSPDVSAGDTIVDIYSVEEFRQALEKNQNIHIRLQADIIFTKSNAHDVENGTVLGEGYYTIDLNSHTVKYQFKGRVGDPDGVPIRTGRARDLVINGPGEVIGGGYGVDQDNQFGMLTINEATLKGVMNSGLCMKGGLATINSGTLTGNFYGVFHTDGIVVVNGGKVKSIVTKTMGHTPRNMGVIKDGVFTGHANIDEVILILPKLTIDPKSSMRIFRHGGLVVTGAFVNQGKYTYESGLEAINGQGRISSDAQVKLAQDLNLNSLTINNQGSLFIDNGATVTVKGPFVNDKGLVHVNKGLLNLLGTIDNRGTIEGVPGLENDHGGGPPQNDQIHHKPSDWAAPEIELVKETWLKESRLFTFYQNNITREEFCELVVKLYENMKGEEAPLPEKNPFVDADMVDVQKANMLGIVTGRGQGRFDPGGYITRQEMATMYVRLLDALDINVPVTMEYVFFADEGQIHSYAKNAVQTMYKLGILKGQGENRIGPLNYSTREQAISLSNRVYMKFKNS